MGALAIPGCGIAAFAACELRQAWAFAIDFKSSNIIDLIK
jgi:hypothetical protein